MKEFLIKALRMLTEKEKDKNKKYSYGCVMAYIEPSAEMWEGVQEIVDEEDVMTDDGLGRETEPHCTLLYGIHEDVPDEDVEAIINTLTAPEITLDKISTFDNPNFEVLKFDVTNDKLKEYNKKFTELPHTTDFPDYHAHVTICYLKKGTGEKYIGKLPQTKILKSTKIVYSKPDGTKKEYPFGNNK